MPQFQHSQGSYELCTEIPNRRFSAGGAGEVSDSRVPTNIPRVTGTTVRPDIEVILSVSIDALSAVLGNVASPSHRSLQ
jgi:hypothetical protein